MRQPGSKTHYDIHPQSRKPKHFNTYVKICKWFVGDFFAAYGREQSGMEHLR